MQSADSWACRAPLGIGASPIPASTIGPPANTRGLAAAGCADACRPRRRRLTACGLTALAWASFGHPLPRLTYNPSDSVAVGWYRVDLLDHRAGSLPPALPVGSIVLTKLPPDAAALAARRGYLPARIPLLKRVGAIAPQTVCVAGGVLSIDGVPSAALLPAGPTGRVAAGLAAAGGVQRAQRTTVDGANAVQPAVPLVRRVEHRRSGMGPLDVLVQPGTAARCRGADVPPVLSSTAIWSSIPHETKIGQEEALFRRTDQLASCMRPKPAWR